jgi:hypothetical protein
VLAQREGDVVEEVHRPEERAVLEQHAEELPDFVELVLARLHDVDAVDDDRAALRLEQADQRLEEHRLAGARGAQQHGDLPRREGERDVAPDVLAAEGLGQPLDLDRDPHEFDPPRRRLRRSPVPPRSAGSESVRRLGTFRIRTTSGRFLTGQ